ncbi:MAG: hypothetical protein M3008_13490, partial [Chloroflexota bacterium]|nr:hypothetical protein [Chloroflexota bacterium]
MRRWGGSHIVLFTVLVLAISIGLSGCSGGQATTAPAASGGGAKAGPASLYPNPSLTPGDVLPGVTAKEVCV